MDGSVLFANILRKIGIKPFLVIVSGHIFLGYYTNEDYSGAELLETTMLGNADISKYPRGDTWWDKVKIFFGKTEQSSIILDSFIDAQDSAWHTLEQTGEDDIIMIDIEDASAEGIKPVRRN